MSGVPAGNAHVELVHTMGTVVTVDVREGACREVVAAGVVDAAEHLHRADAVFSTWLDDSWGSRLLRGEVTPEDCPSQVREVLALAAEVCAATDGWFTAGWRSDAAGPDPTGLVKGWSAQQASDRLLAHGLADHVVNAAGDLVLSGTPSGRADRVPGAEGDVWRIGIADPHRQGSLVGVLELPAGPWRWAVATSGTAERGRHVRDPHTGQCPDAVAAATVVARLDAALPEAGAWTDGCATALVAAGTQASELLPCLPVRGLLVHADGGVTDPDGLLLPAAV